MDNGASHRNWAAAARLTDAYPNAQMVHLPVHASWLNQVEVYFSVIQRKLLTPDDFEDLDELAAQILAFQKHYNAAARPFDWKFTRADLNRLLARIRQHDRHAPQPADRINPDELTGATTSGVGGHRIAGGACNGALSGRWRRARPKTRSPRYCWRSPR